MHLIGERFGNPPLVAAAELGAGQKAAIQEALLAMHQNPKAGPFWMNC